MNREIKFRAWSKKDHCWVGGFSIHNTGLVSCLISPDGNAHWDEEKEDLIIMQYTGLKDSNGKEIYESDVVRWKEPVYMGEPLRHKAEVIYYSGSFCLEMEEGTFAIGEYEHMGLEVIGNIYENPELLKPKPIKTVQVHDEEDFSKVRLVDF